MFRVVVDDLRSFAFDAVYARTSAEALALLAQLHADGVAVDELWLDHDLGGDDTVVPVVDWLCERCVWDDPPAVGRVVVHTSNPVGASMIERTLQRWFPVTRVDASAAGAYIA
jgi:hypothetical protein